MISNSLAVNASFDNVDLSAPHTIVSLHQQTACPEKWRTQYDNGSVGPDPFIKLWLQQSDQQAVNAPTDTRQSALIPVVDFNPPTTSLIVDWGKGGTGKER